MLVMDLCRIIQIGKPSDLYQNPENKFVYGFLGLSNFLKVVKENDFIYAKGESKTPIPYSLPEGLQDGEGLLASRPNEIEISNKEGGGYPAVIEKRLYMTFCIEYQVRIGSQVIRVHTSHSNVFKEGSRCFLTFKNPRWYEKESEALEKERTERQVI